jgi:ribosomal protein S3
MTSTYFFDKANRTHTMSLQRQAISIINAFFAKDKSLVGKPVFSLTPDKVVVQLFYYASGNTLSNASIATLGNALTRCWGRTVELRLVRINHSALDSSIFAQYLTDNTNKYSFNRILDLLKDSIPTVVSDGSVSDTTTAPLSHITGVKVKLSGRLTTQRSGPRQTVQAGRVGTSAKGSYGTVDYSQHTAKNKLGAFTMKVWISQQSR